MDAKMSTVFSDRTHLHHIVVSPHIAEKFVFETCFVDIVKANINLAHDLTIPKEKIAADSLSPVDFHLIVHGSACTASLFGMRVQSVRQVSSSKL